MDLVRMVASFKCECGEENIVFRTFAIKEAHCSKCGEKYEGEAKVKIRWETKLDSTDKL